MTDSGSSARSTGAAVESVRELERGARDASITPAAHELIIPHPPGMECGMLHEPVAPDVRHPESSAPAEPAVPGALCSIAHPPVAIGPCAVAAPESAEAAPSPEPHSRPGPASVHWKRRSIESRAAKRFIRDIRSRYKMQRDRP